MPEGEQSPLNTYLAHLDKGELAYQYSPEAGRAVFYPRDEQFLVDRDLTVRHYEVYGSHGLTG